MNNSSRSSKPVETPDSEKSASGQSRQTLRFSRPRKVWPKPSICLVIILLTLTILAPGSAANAQECEPGYLYYIVRDEKGETLSPKALELIRRTMRNPAQKVGTVVMESDGTTFGLYSGQTYEKGTKIPALDYVDVEYRCRMKVTEATLTYHGKTMRLLFNVDVPNQTTSVHGFIIDSLPFQEGTFKLDLSKIPDNEHSRMLSAQRWQKVDPAMPLVDLTGASDSELQKHLGERVTMRGQFSLRGKIGPFIRVGGRPIYLVPNGTFSWGKQYARMEGKDVNVTGTLRFAHYPVPPPPALPEGRASDHFYFDAETAKVKLSGK